LLSPVPELSLMDRAQESNSKKSDAEDSHPKGLMFQNHYSLLSKQAACRYAIYLDDFMGSE
jgi:hypothetical protein